MLHPCLGFSASSPLRECPTLAACDSEAEGWQTREHQGWGAPPRFFPCLFSLSNPSNLSNHGYPSHLSRSLSKVPACYWVLLTLFLPLGASEGKLAHQDNRETTGWLPSSESAPPRPNEESLLPTGFARRHGVSQVHSHPQ